jgi:Ca2+-binding RTX toxin-like protein
MNQVVLGEPFYPAVAGLANGSYFGVWTDPNQGGSSYYNVKGRVIGSNGTPATSEFLVNNTVTNTQSEASVAGLIDGRAVVTFTDFSTDSRGDIRARLFSGNGGAFAVDFALVTDNGLGDTNSDVAALADGGFVASWDRDFGSGDLDVRAAVFNSDGSVRKDLIGVDSSISLATYNSSVAGLAGGGFVVAWEQTPVAGGDSDLYFRRYDASGNGLDATSRVLDGSPFSQSDVQIAALPDGGFVAAYTGWDSSALTTDIIARVFNADGSPRTGYLPVNSATRDVESRPTLTVLSNGFFVVGWGDYSEIAWLQAYTAVGLAAGPNTSVASHAIETEIAALSGGLVATVDSSRSVDAGLDGSIGSYINELTRTITGDATNETLTGDSLRDTIDGGAGADVMSGGGNDDIYFVDNAGDAVVELLNNGNDTVNSLVSYALPANVETLFLGGAANLQGYGNGLNNTLTGNNGSNLLDGGAGADAMHGQAGNDTYFVDHASDQAVEASNNGNDTIFASISFTLPNSVENLILQGGTDLQGYGNSNANVLYGNTGNNLLNGGGFVDLMVGGAGNDTYFADDTSDSCFEVAGQGNDTVFAATHYGLAADVENLILQIDLGDLQGYGNNQANVIYGNEGDNLINAAGGIDLMVGGFGDDTYFADNSSDSCFEVAGQGNDAVFASAHYGLAADVETLVLQGSADLQGYGSNQANSIYGNAGNNLLNGAGGADIMLGGAGNDTYFVDNAGDGVVENPGEGSDAVFSTVGYGLTANVETLVLQGSGNINGTGNTLANAIFGNSGVNTLDGGGGGDTLSGSTGNDVFVFRPGQANGDMVVDFAGNGAAAGDSLQFIGYGGGATFTRIDATRWRVDYVGDGSPDIITFMNGASIDASDFQFV